MSLQITHIRFALDLHKELNITSLDQYISGTIYPDSRYMTGIDRSLTHSDTLLTQFDSEDQLLVTNIALLEFISIHENISFHT